MKNTWCILPAFMVFWCGLPVRGQTTGPADASPKSSFFIQAAGGFDVSRFTSDDFYNQQLMGAISLERNTGHIGILDFTGSLACGVDFPDSFSLFASSEWFQYDWSVLANARYAFWSRSFIKAYLFGGLGMDFNASALGPSFQLGLGSDFPLDKSFGLYVEAKGFIALLFYSNNLNPTLDFRSFESFTPVLAGLKYTL